MKKEDGELRMEDGERHGTPTSERPAAAASDPWLLWQVIDSAFPTGGFAHSGGVEATWQHGMLADGPSLQSFVRSAIRQAARGATPIALAVLREPTAFAEWDAFFDATVSNHVANRASRAQGRAFLITAAATFDVPALTKANDIARRAKTPCHLSAAFGLVAGALGIPADVCTRAFLFLIARGLVSAAVRLGVVGPMEGQRLQADEAPHVEASVQLALRCPPEQISQTAFFADLLQATQDRLYSRLFQS